MVLGLGCRAVRMLRTVCAPDGFGNIDGETKKGDISWQTLNLPRKS